MSVIYCNANLSAQTVLHEAFVAEAGRNFLSTAELILNFCCGIDVSMAKTANIMIIINFWMPGDPPVIPAVPYNRDTAAHNSGWTC